MTITNLNPASSTPTKLPYPIHRLNTPQMKMWLISVSWRREQAARFSERYRGGVGILSPTMFLFALVDPRGNIVERHPPYHRFEMWQIANRPKTEICPCADFFDPEVGGAWKLRPEWERGVHHPLCQFDRHAKTVFAKAATLANERLDRGEKNPQARPDEWNRLRDQEASR